MIVMLKGGLGNQMFQYAFGKALEVKMGINIKYDIDYYKKYNSHNGYELESVFGILLESPTMKEIKESKDEFYFYRIRKRISSILVRKTHIIEKKEFSYDVSIRHSNLNYYDGYWQNQNYFISIEDIIRSIFQFKTSIDDINRDHLLNIQNTESCSIHVRRGDYLDNKLYANICGLRYYLEAIKYIETKVYNVTFFVFSNDIEWCKENLRIKNAVFVYGNFNDKAYLDMMLMSKCKYNIIANSSFSWWAAWLNGNERKIVVAPKKWINGSSESPVPDSWIKFDNNH